MAAADGPQTTKLMVARGDEVERDGAVYKFFGSARSRTPKQHASEVENAKDILAANPEDPAASAKLAQLEKCAWLSDFYNKTAELSERLTEWSMSRPLPDGVQRYTVCTGGGPGMMKAANLGASRVPGALSMGMGISLPFETSMNAYVTRGLGFEYHYFFTRKFQMVRLARALVVAPGGVGTLDELFETMTLLQTKKIKIQKVPIVLLGKKYWQSVINMQAMVDAGTIAASDVDRLFYTDDVEEAFQHVTARLLEVEEEEAQAAIEAIEKAGSTPIVEANATR